MLSATQPSCRRGREPSRVAAAARAVGTSLARARGNLALLRARLRLSDKELGRVVTECPVTLRQVGAGWQDGVPSCLQGLARAAMLAGWCRG